MFQFDRLEIIQKLTVNQCKINTSNITNTLLLPFQHGYNNLKKSILQMVEKENIHKYLLYNTHVIIILKKCTMQKQMLIHVFITSVNLKKKKQVTI